MGPWTISMGWDTGNESVLAPSYVLIAVVPTKCDIVSQNNRPMEEEQEISKETSNKYNMLP